MVLDFHSTWIRFWGAFHDDLLSHVSFSWLDPSFSIGLIAGSAAIRLKGSEDELENFEQQINRALKLIAKHNGLEQDVRYLRIFIYDRSFDTERFAIGLRFNEHWTQHKFTLVGEEYSTHFGTKYPHLLLTKYSILEDITNARNVEPLKFAYEGEESDLFDFRKPEISAVRPISVQLKDCRFLILLNSNYKQYFRKRPGNYWVEFVVPGEPKLKSFSSRERRQRRR
ncbi:hypothetical protein FF011L_24810 [Roseimaritima multifibrata]|uniref:Uncharacterized protein n=1 Tax=Roseimaritima multifibrata TaxID=1930274 RepID=A0A517MFQ3_9BACT|nr:hypothetical protein FF011L_24810 [Roseimaritima multifibrata]